MDLTLEVNGRRVEVDVPETTLLADLLRDTLGLTGTHVGCDTSQCGACVVHVDGCSIKSCSVLAVALEGSKVTTIEGLAATKAGSNLHPMQTAFRENHGLQCGFCTPGMIMSAVEFANSNAHPSETEVRAWLEGNICRCTGYQNIVSAVIAGAHAMHAEV